MKTKEDIINNLYEYEEDELLYKQYYVLRNHPIALHYFLNSLDEEYVKSHYLLMKEFPFIKITNFFTNNPQDQPEFIKRRREGDININKHLRYTPTFSHSHDYFEIVYMLKGSCQQTLQNESLPLHEGDLCFIPPYQEHTLEIFDDSIAINLMIQKESFAQILLPVLKHQTILSDFFISHLYSRYPMQRLVFMTAQDQDIKNNILDIYIEHSYNDSYTQSIISHMVQILFINLLRHHSNHINTISPQKHIHQQTIDMIRYIYNNYQNISLEALATQFHYSTAHISRLIKEESGYHYKDFVRNIRLEQCKEMLLASPASIAAIAEMVGYENPESLIRAFEKQFHITPTQYRNLHTKGQ